MVKIGNSWDDLLANFFADERYQTIRNVLVKAYSEDKVYPPADKIFNAFKLTPYENVKVVIMGQDPYHAKGQANGLCFSVGKGIDKPPSLKNIFLCLKNDYGIDEPSHGDLTSWASEGVLLLNSVLTVLEGRANSHKDIGWGWFSDEVIKILGQREKPIVFMLWGNYAKSKIPLIAGRQHLILTAVHPSPLSCYNGFLTSGHFKRANEFLIKNGETPIRWQID